MLNQPILVNGAPMPVANWNLPSFPILKLAPAALLCTLVMLTGCLQLSAQSTQEIDLSEFAYSVTVSGGTLNANESATVTLTLGNGDAPLSDVVAIRLDLVLSDYAYLPTSSLQPNVQSSWAYDPSDYAQSLSVNAEAHSMSLTLTRNSGSADGHGFTFSFPLVVCCNGVNANSLVLSDGGVVIVENIDLRLSNPRPGAAMDLLDLEEPVDAPSLGADMTEGDSVPDDARMPMDMVQTAALRLYPNPSHDQVNFCLSPPNDAAVLRLTGMDGQVHELPVTREGGIGVSDIQPLPRGWYVAELLQSGAVRCCQRLLLE